MTAGNLMLNETACDSATGRERASWRLIGRFGCLAQAEAAVQRLHSNGIDATICAIDGVAVLARK